MRLRKGEGVKVAILILLVIAAAYRALEVSSYSFKSENALMAGS